MTVPSGPSAVGHDHGAAGVELLSTFGAADPAAVSARRPPAAHLPVVRAVSLTELTMALLLAVVEGRSPAAAVDRLARDGFVATGGPHGPWLTRLPDALRDVLADADPEDLRRYATGWPATVELARADPSTTHALLAELAALARTARAEKKALCLWYALRASGDRSARRPRRSRREGAAASGASGRRRGRSARRR